MEKPERVSAATANRTPAEAAIAARDDDVDIPFVFEPMNPKLKGTSAFDIACSDVSFNFPPPPAPLLPFQISEQ